MGESPRVAIIGTRGFPSYYGGFETLVRHLAPYLAERGWDVDVYSRPRQVAEEKIPAGVTQRFTRGVESKSASTLSYGLTACADAARRKPDVALVMNVANGYFLPMLKARGIPVVLNVDGLEWEREKWSTPAKRVFHTGATMTARFADTSGPATATGMPATDCSRWAGSRGTTTSSSWRARKSSSRCRQLRTRRIRRWTWWPAAGMP
ncbi:glycosyltransferase family protein [Flexivirga lutea]